MRGPYAICRAFDSIPQYISKQISTAIVPLARFTFYERVMDPLDISRNPTKEKGKRVASPSITSSSSSSSNDNGVCTILSRFIEEIYSTMSSRCFYSNMRSTDPPYGRSVVVTMSLSFRQDKDSQWTPLQHFCFEKKGEEREV
ncbi:hypothetical protein Tco_1001956 [Tanacetum coccineum]|uniref:Uncharacterized protein n=1 Tax=Tanacetum coccineum TaxID=301880 RepID=A0ABQ5F521_9ASTR